MATSELMKHYQAAVWAQHGLFASGPDFDITFGLAHTIEKSAEIYVKVLSMGGGIIRQTITDDDLRAIAHDFGVTLNEKFLNSSHSPPFFFILAEQASCPIPPNGIAGCLFCFMFPGTPWVFFR